MSTLDVGGKFTLARSVGEECIQEEELRLLFEKKPHPVVYDGFEPSGRMHIAQGVLRAINVNKLTKCGCIFKVRRQTERGRASELFSPWLEGERGRRVESDPGVCRGWQFWVADWFAQLNNKMEGDLKKIQTVGRYMIEIWRVVGMDMRNVEFLWASEEINNHAEAYWSRVMEIARLNNLAR